MNAKAIGKRLRELRGIRTRTGVAKETGIGYSAIANYETGKRIPNDHAKIILASYYGLSVQELFYASDYHNEE